MRRALAILALCGWTIAFAAPALADDTPAPSSSATVPASGPASVPTTDPSPTETPRPDSSTTITNNPGEEDLSPTVLPEGVGLAPGEELPLFIDEGLWQQGPAKFTIWPLVNAELWVPLRQGWIRFDRPVKASTAKFALTQGDGVFAGEVIRVTKGEQVKEVRFNFPTLEPGDYVLTYEAQARDGSMYTAEIPFAIMEHEVGIGGGNHRHSSVHVKGERPVEAAIRVLVLIAAAALLSVHAFRRESLITEWAARPAWLVMSFAGALGVIWSMFGEQHDVGDYLTDKLGSAVFWTWSALLIASLVMLVRPRPASRASALVPVGALLAVAYSSHVAFAKDGFLLATWEFAALVSAAFSISVLTVRAAVAYGVPSPPGRWSARSNLLLMLVSPAAMLGVLYGYVGSFDPVLSHWTDLLVKAVASAVWLTAAALAAFTPKSERSPKLARILSTVSLVLALAAAAVLTSLPPGAAGI